MERNMTTMDGFHQLKRPLCGSNPICNNVTVSLVSAVPQPLRTPRPIVEDRIVFSPNANTHKDIDLVELELALSGHKQKSVLWRELSQLAQIPESPKCINLRANLQYIAFPLQRNCKSLHALM
jgi:hypothetical protein